MSKPVNTIAIRSLRKGGIISRFGTNKAKIFAALKVAQTDARKISLVKRQLINASFLNRSNFVASQGAIPLRDIPLPSLSEINALIAKLK